MEIKIRLFDKISKKMYYDGELENGELVVMGLDGKLQFSDQKTYRDQDFEKMLYTGIIDKNGNKIYLGDIVKYLNKKWLIKWNRDYTRFHMYPLFHTIYKEMRLILDFVEIIGNEFETPELLEVKNK